MGDRFGHVKINSKDYRIDLNTYRGRDVSDFSPRVSTPGGSVVYSELGLYQTLTQTDWRHGFGSLWHADASAYHWSFHVDTRFKGRVQLATTPIALNSVSINNPLTSGGWRADRGFAYAHTTVDYIIGYGEMGCFVKLATLAAANVTVDLQGFNVKYVWSNGSYIFFCPVGLAATTWVGNVPTNDGSARILRSTSGLITTTSELTASGGGANYLDDADAAFTDDQYNGYTIFIQSGTGAGQYRQIDDTVGGATQRLTVTANWTVNPNNTSKYRIVNLTQAGVNANCVGYNWITSHDGYVFAGKSNYVYYASTVDLSDLHGAVSDDPTAIVVGTPGRDVRGAISYNGDLYFARIDGLYRMEKDKSGARKILDYSDQVHPFNFQTMVVYNGNLVFPIGNQLFQWNGVRVSPITPPADKPTNLYNRFRSACVHGNYLYILATDVPVADSVYTSAYIASDHILCFDGVGWHNLYSDQHYSTVEGKHNTTGHYFMAPLTDDVNFVSIPTMAIISTGNNANTYPNALWFYKTRLSFMLYDSSDTYRVAYTGVDYSTYVIQFSMRNDYPVAYYKTGGAPALSTSRIDAGFRRIQKSLSSLLVYGSDLAAGQYIKVYYRLNDVDEGSYTAWGGVDGTTNVVNTDGATELTNPYGPSDARKTLEFYWIEFYFRLFTSSEYRTPILEGFMPRLLLRPDTYYGYSFNIIGASNNEYSTGLTDGRTPKDILNDLHTARASVAPIIYIDPFGISHYAYITSLTELAVEEHIDDMGAYPNIEQVIQVNIVSLTKVT